MSLSSFISYNPFQICSFPWMAIIFFILLFSSIEAYCFNTFKQRVHLILISKYICVEPVWSCIASFNTHRWILMWTHVLHLVLSFLCKLNVQTYLNLKNTSKWLFPISPLKVCGRTYLQFNNLILSDIFF